VGYAERMAEEERQQAERMAEEKRKDAERLAIEEWKRAFPLKFQPKPNPRRYAERMADQERQASTAAEADNTSVEPPAKRVRL